jgi:hypothetical protein
MTTIKTEYCGCKFLRGDDRTERIKACSSHIDISNIDIRELLKRIEQLENDVAILLGAR